MPQIVLKNAYKIYAANSNTVIREIPAVTMPVTDVLEITQFRGEMPFITARNGAFLQADKPIGQLFSCFSADQTVRTLLQDMPVYEEYTYKTAQGGTDRAWDKRSVDSYLPLPKY